MSGNRIFEIDIAKGICILLMVVGHSGAPKDIINFIYVFHMPFFFFVSGITTNVNKPFMQFLKGKAKGLLVPFLVYYAIYLFSYGLLYDKGFLGQLESDFQTHIRSALWFVPILFMGQMINKIIPLNHFVEIMAILVLAAISSFLCLENVDLPWCLSGLGFATSFVLLGRIMSVGGAEKILFQSSNLIKAIFCIAASAVVVLFVSIHYQKLEINYNRVNPVMIKMVGAMAGIVMVMMVSGVLKRWKLLRQPLAYTGVNTFVFIGLSQIVLKVVNLYIYDHLILKYTIVFFVLYAIIYLKNMVSFTKAL